MSTSERLLPLRNMLLKRKELTPIFVWEAAPKWARIKTGQAANERYGSGEHYE